MTYKSQRWRGGMHLVKYHQLTVTHCPSFWYYGSPGAKVTSQQCVQKEGSNHQGLTLNCKHSLLAQRAALTNAGPVGLHWFQQRNKSMTLWKPPIHRSDTRDIQNKKHPPDGWERCSHPLPWRGQYHRSALPRSSPKVQGQCKRTCWLIVLI